MAPDRSRGHLPHALVGHGNGRRGRLCFRELPLQPSVVKNEGVARRAQLAYS